jgi:hypothetical protein
MNHFQLAAICAGLVATVAVAGCDGKESPTTTTPTPRPLALAGRPYMGIACGRPNSISSATACDRVGLAVWLKRPAQHVTASIAGRPLTLSNTGRHGERLGYWEAFLHPAGLGHGPLRLPRHRGDHWAGKPAVRASVQVTAEYGDGSSSSTRKRVALSPGYG